MRRRGRNRVPGAAAGVSGHQVFNILQLAMPFVEDDASLAMMALASRALSVPAQLQYLDRQTQQDHQQAMKFGIDLPNTHGRSIVECLAQRPMADAVELFSRMSYITRVRAMEVLASSGRLALIQAIRQVQPDFITPALAGVMLNRAAYRGRHLVVADLLANYQLQSSITAALKEAVDAGKEAVVDALLRSHQLSLPALREVLDESCCAAPDYPYTAQISDDLQGYIAYREQQQRKCSAAAVIQATWRRRSAAAVASAAAPDASDGAVGAPVAANLAP